MRKDFWGTERDESAWNRLRITYIIFDLVFWAGIIVGVFTGEWLAVCAIALVGIGVELGLIKHGGPS